MNSLAWDEHRNLLYIGGKFHAVDNAGIPPGLAVWSPVEGLLPFPGGGVTLKDGQPGEVQALILEPKSRVGVSYRTHMYFNLSLTLLPLFLCLPSHRV